MGLKVGTAVNVFVQTCTQTGQLAQVCWCSYHSASGTAGRMQLHALLLLLLLLLCLAVRRGAVHALFQALLLANLTT